MKNGVFLSYPVPFEAKQQEFIDKLSIRLKSEDLEPRTLGVTDYSMSAPLTTIRRLMLESNGLITVAFRRAMIAKGTGKPGAKDEYDISGRWITSPYSHIEPAMAYQIGLPVLVLRQSGVMDDGILKQGVLGLYMPVFDLTSNPDDYLDSEEFKQILRQWILNVRKVVDTKGAPPILY